MQSDSRIPQVWGWLSSLWILMFWILCVGVPLSYVMGRFFESNLNMSLFFDRSVLAIVKMTVFQASVSTFISGAIGLFLGLRLGQLRSKRIRAWIEGLYFIPFGVPTVISGFAWVAILGRSGLLARWGFHFDLAYSLTAVVIAHVFFNAPWVAFLVSERRSHICMAQLEAAKLLGAHPWQEFRTLVWPWVRRSFASACAQVMVLCLMSFALVLILGGGPPVQTLETEIYRHLRYGTLDMAGASVLACWELLLTLIPWGFVLFLRQPQGLEKNETSRPDSLKEKEGDFREALVLACIGILFVLPYFVVIQPDSLKQVFASAWSGPLREPLVVSFQLALCSGFFTVITAIFGIVCLGYWRNSRGFCQILSIFLMIPAGISALVLSLGVWLAYGSWIDPLEGSLAAMVVLQTTLFFPFAFRVLWPLARETTSSIKQIEMALLLGATPLQAFLQVEWPRWRVPLLSAFVGVAAASLGEVAAVSLFYSEKVMPLPFLIARRMSQYRFDEAQAVASLLFLLSTSAIVGSFYVHARSRFKKLA